LEALKKFAVSFGLCHSEIADVIYKTVNGPFSENLPKRAGPRPLTDAKFIFVPAIRSKYRKGTAGNYPQETQRVLVAKRHEEN